MLRKLATIGGTIIGVGVVIFVFGLAITLMGAARPQQERQAPVDVPPSVFFTVAESVAVTLDVAAQGEVRPRTDIILTTQVAGKIVATAPAFVNGGAFKKGELLVKIEDADYRAAAASAKARVAQAHEALKREEAETALARQDYEELGLEGEATDLTLRIPQLAQARANYEAARADHDAAKLNLARTEIRADFDGRVRERSAGVGQYAAPGSQLGRIFSTDVAEVRLALTDSDLAKLGLPIAFTETGNRVGPKVVLNAAIAGQLRTWTGRIARTDGAIDPTTRQLSAIAVVEDPYGEGAAEDGTPLAIGLFVDAVIEGQPYDEAYVLPRTALYGRDRVYVIRDDDTLEERRVTIISTSRDTVTASAGVRPGERIAASPLRGAGEGDKVVPLDPASPLPGEISEEREAEAIARAGGSGGAQ